MNNRVWVLGAPDPEMEKIEALLAECGEQVMYATAGGKRVHAAIAYDDRNIARGDPAIDYGSPSEVILVECRVGIADHVRMTVIDHHHPGDPGYGRPASEFLPASSIGQVVAKLAWIGRLPEWGAGHSDESLPAGSWDEAEEPAEIHTGDGFGRNVPHEIVLCAAADHCLGAAYRGECPGVDPEALTRWRARSRAAFQGRDPSDVIADIQATTEALKSAPVFRFDGTLVRDMRRDPPYPELPEAATRTGTSYISGPLATPDGRKKYTVSGTAEVVRMWMDTWAPSQGITGIYGDPARGFAGGYLDD